MIAVSFNNTISSPSWQLEQEGGIWLHNTVSVLLYLLFNPYNDALVQNTNTMHFHELVAAASKFEFSQDGIHAVTRDYMHTTLWDVRKTSQPVQTFQVRPTVCQSGYLLCPCCVSAVLVPCSDVLGLFAAFVLHVRPLVYL